MKRIGIVGLAMAMLALGGCAGTGGGMGSVEKTNALIPGMTTEEVRAVLGQPAQSQFVEGNLVWKYSLHQYWKGYVPYYLVFDEGKPPTLRGWFANEQEYARQQQLWMQAIPPTQRYEVDMNVH
ncbi:outer membrane protein assembly factor BamE domain-containing protein [Pseudomonas saliphila]|uniref:outer membrane protein assembly factor BamE domain-containing protein n=1 Tax=Pseudomonas saliphila TaxID=2586906 RepID=UPI0015B3AB32|nr:outer membrane protein assembly factor BamE [Pseudomonas saliphila]